jgi:hypothetical protein
LNERPIGRKNGILAGILATAFAFSLAPQAGAATPPTAALPPNPTAASAKPDLTAAKRHYADGERKYKAGDYTGALAEFEAANEVKATPQAERYLGLCEDSLGQLREATSWYDKFLEHVPERMATQGDEIRKRDAEIKSLPGKVHIESNPPGASVTIDGKALTTVTPTDTELLPGSHTIRLTQQGRLPTEKPIDVAFASSQTVSADLDAEPPPAVPVPAPAPIVAAPAPAPVPPPMEPRSKVPAFVTGGLAIAAVGVGTVFGVLALNDKSDFDKNPTTNTADNGDTHALVADMAFGVALTFGVTSAVLFLSKDEQPNASPTTAKAAAARPLDAKRAKTSGLHITPTPWVGPRSGGAGFVLRF